MDYWPNINFKSVEARRSFTLLETIVAIYVLLSGIVGAMSLASENLKALSYFRDQLIAANLAQEGAELVRNRRDSNFLKCGSDSEFCNSGSSTFDYNSQNMDGMESVCTSPKVCRVLLPLTDGAPQFEECGDGNCEYLDQNPDTGVYDVYTANGKYSRKIELKEITDYNRGTLSDWHIKVTVSWRDRIVDRSVIVNDVLTPHLRF